MRTYVGNAKILGATIRNFSTNPTRRLDLIGTIPRTADVNKAIAEVRAHLAKVSNLAPDPAPEVRVLSVCEHHFHLAIRPHVSEPNYWPVYFDVVEGLRDVLNTVGPAAIGHSHGEGAEAAEGGEEGEGGRVAKVV